MTQPVDFRVRTGNPTALNETLRQLPMGGASVVDGSWDGDTCLVRCFSNEDFIRYAIINQGYGEIVKDRELEK